MTDSHYSILQGNSLHVLPTLPDDSIQSCITSPPYWGLRDYGTATWEGGTMDCDHAIPDYEQDPKNPGAGSHISRYNKESCFKCGAKRIDAQIGLEDTPDQYVQKLVLVFREVRRVLKKDGTLWLNLGDSYNGSGGAGGDYGPGGLKEGQPKYPGRNIGSLKPKDLVGIPWRVAFALQADGWYLRSDIIWAKPNPMPESVTDRPTKSHEYLFLLTKNKDYYYDANSIKERVKQDWGTRDRTNGKYHTEGSGLQPHSGLEKSYGTANKRSVWWITTQPYPDAHFAVFPEALVEPCIKAGSKSDDFVLDPFCGSGTTGVVALKHGRRFVGIELNPDYIKLAESRFKPWHNHKLTKYCEVHA